MLLRGTLWLTPCGREEKERRFLSASALSELFEMSSLSIISWEKTQLSLYPPLEPWPPSVWQYPFILFPAAPCLSVLVFFCKCSWHFVYLSFKHSAKIMSENEKKRKENAPFFWLNLLQRKQFSTILKTLRMFQGTRKSPANGWAQSGLEYKRD